VNKGKICLIYTGGTIGMVSKGGVLTPVRGKEFESSVLKKIPELEDIAEYKFIDLLSKDATNMHPNDWVKLSNEIHNQIKTRKYQGFVVVHGTDTMHFSASAVALALGENLNVPVVFTGAQTAFSVPHGDARVNLLRAFKVALSNIAEVVICFGDYVFRGCRSLKKDERRFDAFWSPAYPPLAYIGEELIIHDKSLFRERKEARAGINFVNVFSEGIIQVSLIPGLDPIFFSSLIEDGNCNGFILHSFGAGNVPNEGDYSWMRFIKEASENGIPILITSQFPANSAYHSPYAPGRDAYENGAIPTLNMTYACASAKFRWLLAQFADMEKDEKIDQLKLMMNHDYVGELDKPHN